MDGMDKGERKVAQRLKLRYLLRSRWHPVRDNATECEGVQLLRLDELTVSKDSLADAANRK